ncbi:hypothetical protein [Sphaerotilus sp.]|uniref:hypothetical protein n=1 Tax=Sphaerotilus sp. TaxID=2093942 RepID=UPI002ACE12B5|nr:hypothetical protein [Sphaerotilus sp.]MDZ7855946.1 hypothetical protein [Sphaerotilus sp.]
MKVVLLALLAAWLPAASAAQQRVAVTDARPLLIAAIDAADGQARGVLTGQLADAITQRFKATTPIYIDVDTERRYVQAGCRRLKVRFWQDGVQLPGVPVPRRQTVDFGINYCRDGLPPKSPKEMP